MLLWKHSGCLSTISTSSTFDKITANTGPIQKPQGEEYFFASFDIIPDRSVRK